MNDRKGARCADPDAERAWLACVLLDDRTLESAPVAPEDFDVAGHALVVHAMLSLRRAGVPIDTVTIRVELDRTGNLRRAGGDEMLLGLTSQVPNARTAFVLAGRIQELAELRRRKEHAQRIVQACDGQQVEEARILSATLASSYDPSTVKILNFREVTQSTLQSYSDMGTERDKTLKLGTPTVDDMWSPYPGSLTVLGAATGSGKTSLLSVWALSLGRREIPVGVISVEDPEQDFGGKWLGELGGPLAFADEVTGEKPSANPSRFWRGKAEAADHALVLRAAAENENLPIFFAHVKSRKLDDVLAAMRGMARRHRTRVVMLDYLQVIRSRQPHRDRRDAIDSVLDDLVVEAGMLDQALVLASQLSRDGAKQTEPRVQDLKESGTIEERSQAIVLIWPDEKKHDVVHGKVAKVKRVTRGRRFQMTRNPLTGALVEENDYAEDDGYNVGGYSGKKK